MKNRDEEVRELIACQAADWFVTQRDGPLGARERAAFDEWLLASPVHVEEYLGVTVIALALPTAADDSDSPFDEILERCAVTREADVRLLRGGLAQPTDKSHSPSFWNGWRVAAGALLSAVIGGLLLWNVGRVVPQRYATAHGEQRSISLRDRSVVRLNIDTGVTVRYGAAERLVEIDRGEAYFEVTHEPTRPFRVAAGATNIVAVGTQFDVHRDQTSTIVTIVAGHVIVSSDSNLQPGVLAGAGEQVRVIDGILPDRATAVDAQRSIAWLRRQIAFDQEPLGAVVAEFNRYGAVPIEIESPALRAVAISGVFSIGDTETFVAFLRTLDDVTVEATSTSIRVFRRSTTPPSDQ